MQEERTPFLRCLVWGTACGAAALLFSLWLFQAPIPGIGPRLPVPGGERGKPGKAIKEQANPGTVVLGEGTPSTLPGSWPQFRGLKRDNKASSDASLSRDWGTSDLPELWRVEVGEGHAGPVVHQGRLFLVDYDREKEEDAIRCLSLDDGEEIWRFSYSVKIKRNHGMSRTVPAVADGHLVALGPKCHVHCVKMETGELAWKKDLVQEHDTTVPPWYAGQCPLLDGDCAILAPGADPLLMAVDLETGATVWETPNPGGWGMTHSSVMVLDHPKGRQYVYCSTQGVVGISTEDGTLLWSLPEWKIAIANVPSPVPVGNDRIFLSGGYKSGCMMVRLEFEEDKGFFPRVLFQLDHKTFGSEQQTGILSEDFIYGVIPSGELACLDLEGQVRWRSGVEAKFGLGPFLLADGLLLVLNDQRGTLHMVNASPEGYQELAKAKVLEGHDAWGPMAIVGNRLLLRDLTTLICLRLPKR